MLWTQATLTNHRAVRDRIMPERPANSESKSRIRDSTLKHLLDGFSDRLRVSGEIGQYVDKRRAAKWFFGLTLPYALAASALIGWRDLYQPNPGNVESAVRLLLIGIGFAVIFVLLYQAIVRPAMLEYADTQRSETERRSV